MFIFEQGEFDEYNKFANLEEARKPIKKSYEDIKKQQYLFRINTKI